MAAECYSRHFYYGHILAMMVTLVVLVYRCEITYLQQYIMEYYYIK